MTATSMVHTAQLIVSTTEAYVASCTPRAPDDPGVRTHLAALWRTDDRGATWLQVPWRTTWLTAFSRAAFSTWPPEYVETLALRDGKVTLDYWDARTPPIWRATLTGDRWSIRRDREWAAGDARPTGPTAITLALPGFALPTLPTRS